MCDVRLVNDFAALARSMPLLESQHLIPVGGGAARDVGGVTTTAVVGAGTGLGVGGLVITANDVIPLTTEGGHSSFAPTDELEREINRVLLTRFERVSNERILCGEGLVNLHRALAEIEGKPAETLAPRDVTARAAAKSDPLSVLAMEVFSRVMGSFAGDVVLMFGARGGAFVAGGLAPATLDVFDRAAFRARFEAKGRFRRYMEETPAWIVVHPFAALYGAAAMANAMIAPLHAAAE
jgi:glucokinase